MILLHREPYTFRWFPALGSGVRYMPHSWHASEDPARPRSATAPGLSTRRVPADLARSYREAGWWTDEKLGELLARGLAAAPETTLAVHTRTRPSTGTVGEVERSARRPAAGLHRRGVGPGEIVAFELPNWMEAAATYWACALLGTTVVPIAPFYGRKELAYILGA